MNQAGAEVFTDSVARLVGAVQGGEDVSSWFYTKEEYLHSVNRIVCTNFTWTREENGYAVRAYAYCGADVKPEFQFSVRSADGAEWSIVQEFSEDSTFRISAKDAEQWRNSAGHLRVRVEALDGSIDQEQLKEQNVGTDAKNNSIIRSYEEELD